MIRAALAGVRTMAAIACTALLLGSGPAARSQSISVGVIINPFNGDRAGPETDADAAAMLDDELYRTIAAAGGRVARTYQVQLDAAEQQAYGRWNRFGLASGHLADAAARNTRDGLLNLGLYKNCSSLLGMLGGLRHASDPPRRIGLVWIDAHGDYNTPETTLSGMLGGMPVAIAAGDALERMRRQAGLDEPIAKADILMVGVRDTDPLEQERIDRDALPRLSVADVRSLDQAFHDQMAALTERTDVVYVHVDLDVLDPSEIPGHPLTAPDGPTGRELGEAIRAMFHYPKTEALGLASYPYQDDPGGVTRRAIQALVAGAVRGAAERRVQGTTSGAGAQR